MKTEPSNATEPGAAARERPAEAGHARHAFRINLDLGPLTHVIRLIFSLTLLSCVGAVSAAEGNFLNVAVLELPDRYLADIPQAERGAFLLRLSEDANDRRLDYAHGWIHFYSDSDEGAPGTSMLYVKLLPRKDDKPLVLVHMPKPFATGVAPRKNQTFVLELERGEWRDVTSQVIPKQADLTMHFSPRRATDVVEVAAYERIKRQGGRGYSYTLGRRKLDLVWNGRSFDIRKPDKAELSDDDM